MVYSAVIDCTGSFAVVRVVNISVANEKLYITNKRYKRSVGLVCSDVFLVVQYQFTFTRSMNRNVVSVHICVT